jgi:hypothetical protein
MGNHIKLTAILFVLCVLAISPGSYAQQPTAQRPAPAAAAGAPATAAPPVGAPAPAPPAKIDLPTDLAAFDLPNDDGTGVYLRWTALPGESAETLYTIYISESRDGPWLEAVKDQPANTSFMEEKAGYFPGFFAYGKIKVGAEKIHVAVIQQVQAEDKDGALEYDRLGRPITIPQPYGFTVRPNTGPKMDAAGGDGVAVDPSVLDKDGKPKISQKLVVLAPRKIGSMYLKFTATNAGVTAIAPEIFEVNAKENWFNAAKLNTFIFAILFGATILFFIARARRDPNLFIRRIAGLNAVDEAIGRATEMGKPILYINGMDALAGLSTLASLNILGRVARRVANYESSLLVPCRDPIVLTVAQEIVKAGYTDAGRPDSYNADSVFFLTDDQFSYSAAVCGIMMREKPAANFFFGYYYAESLILTETGASTGAIQIAGTDSFTQLPFFVTTCDYTLIGEELYAASAYLSREPLILGSLKGQDAAKVFMMAVIVLGTILVTVGISFVKDLFTQMG